MWKSDLTFAIDWSIFCLGLRTAAKGLILIYIIVVKNARENLDIPFPRARTSFYESKMIAQVAFRNLFTDLLEDNRFPWTKLGSRSISASACHDTFSLVKHFSIFAFFNFCIFRLMSFSTLPGWISAGKNFQTKRDAIYFTDMQQCHHYVQLISLDVVFQGAWNCTGSAVGFKLDSLLKLSDTRASNSRMTLMNYLCKV